VRSQEAGVVSSLAVDEVLAVTADQQVGSVAPHERVASGTAVDGERDPGGLDPRGLEGVVAPARDDEQVLGRSDVEAERLGLHASEQHPSSAGADHEDLGVDAAVDLHAVDAGAAFVHVGIVARVPQQPVAVVLAEDLIVAVAAAESVVLAPAEQAVCASQTGQGVVASLAESWSAPEPPVSVSWSLPPERLARGRAPLASSRLITSSPPCPDTWIDQDHARWVAADLDGGGVAVTDDAQHSVGERRRRGRAGWLADADGHTRAEQAADDQPARCPPPAVIRTPRLHFFAS
jgi:hypothetical protein